MTHQSGPTYVPSTAPNIEDWLTLLRQDSRANPTQTPDSARVPMMTGTSGPIHSESLGKWDPASSFWRTCQASMFDLTMDGHHMAAPWSESWPKSGMTRNGELYPLPMQAHYISETGGGFFPTPTSRDRKDSGQNVNWEPIAKKFKLAGVVHMLPTPSSGGDSGGPHGIRGGSWAKERLVETFGEEDAVAMSGGSLSPDWVSWLMGLPVGWTSLEPLPREEYLEWFHSQQDGTWWLEERGLPRVATGIKDRVNRLKCLGNGIVPASLALFLSSR